MPLIGQVSTQEVPRGQAASPDSVAFLESTAASMALACELGRAMACFRDSGIRALAFKGPVLSVQLYGSPCRRQCEDLDILVSPRDWRRSAEVLHEIGYRADPCPDRFAKHERRMLARSVIDLHRGLMPGWCGFDLEFDELYNRAEMVAVYGTPVRTLCSEDLLLLLCVHAAKHGWTQLKWAADIAGLLRVRPSLDWESLLRTARRLGANRRLLVGVGLAAQLFETGIPAAVAEAIRRDPVAERLTAEICAGPPPAFGYWQRVRLLIATRDDWRGRLLVWLQLARLAARRTEADRSWLARPARLLRVHGPAIVRAIAGGKTAGATASRDGAATNRV